jgi:lipoate-protein ligase B
MTQRGLPYGEGRFCQEKILSSLIRDPDFPEHFLFNEFLPVITMGRAADPSHVLDSGVPIDVETTDRGGDVTWHGPGQWTVYVLLRLDRRGRDLHEHVRLLEEAGIRTSADFGVSASRRKGLSGAWVGDSKIMAVGVGVKKWISFHGLAFNVNCDPANFLDSIVPCGISAQEGTVGNLSAFAGRLLSMEEVRPVLEKNLREVFTLI